MLHNEPTTVAFESDDVSKVRWNLTDLISGESQDPADAVTALLTEADELASNFASKYNNNVATLDSSGLRAAMEHLAKLHDLAGRAGNFAGLNFSTDTSDPARGALLQKVEELGTAIETRILFFELEWAALEDDHVERLLADEQLKFCAHYLRSIRRYRTHLLSEPEEKILSEKSLSGRSAWARLFEEQCSAIMVKSIPNEEPVTLELALSQLYSPDREVRRSTAENVTEALKPGLRTRGFILNTLLADKMVDDRLRKYPHWLASRNLANEASDESVQALVDSVRSRYELTGRWYKLKAKLLGVDRLADYDRMAPVTKSDEKIDWPEARDLVLDSYSSFSPQLGNLVQRFFDENWIDAPADQGKRGGAFCAGTVPSVHPYVLLNYTNRRRDVLTLAHELGHGVHFALSGKQGIFHMSTPLTLAETASVFGEMIVFGRLLDQAPNAESRLSLLAESIEGAIATVFRQIAMHQFEQLAHNERREHGELSIDRISELWLLTQNELLGDSVDVTDNYGSWWSYIPHFINTPGYVYAYAYGQLLSLAIYARYQQEGSSFVDSYIELLSSGGSNTPEELVKVVGIDVADPECWNIGLDLMEQRLEQAEEAAKAAL